MGGGSEMGSSSSEQAEATATAVQYQQTQAGLEYSLQRQRDLYPHMSQLSHIHSESHVAALAVSLSLGGLPLIGEELAEGHR